MTVEGYLYCLIGLSFLLVVLCIKMSNKNEKLFAENSKLKDTIISNTH